MARVRTQKTNFSGGEISPRLLGRGDLRAYENGARTLRNVFIHPTGGVSRRAGLRFIDEALGPGRLISFEFNTEQTYLLVFTNTHCTVYRGGVEVADFVTPWTAAMLSQINWTQSADTLLVVHPDVAPKKITRSSETAWHVSDWVYYTKTPNRIQQPHYRFGDPLITITPSATTGIGITLTASTAFFLDAHVGVRFRIQDKEVHITAVPGGGEPYTTATANVAGTLVDTAATIDWTEQALSPARGWPVAVTFHQDRLVIGGSRDLPNRLWLSKSADLFNFDLGEGLDDEGIEFSMLSDQVNAVRGVFSGRHLQVFTSGAEWMVTGDPLTPGNIQVLRQTRVGSPIDRTVQPLNVDGATIFVARSGDQLREFLFADVEQAYQAGDLAVMSRHLINTPVDMDYDPVLRLLHAINIDGTMSTLTIYRAEQVGAWTLSDTQGIFLSVAVVGDDVYILVDRSGGIYIESLDADSTLDSYLSGTSGTPKTTWTGLDHLEGETVKVLADGTPHVNFGGIPSDLVVSGGAITLLYAASAVSVGLGYTHTVEPLPPGVGTVGAGAQGAYQRPIKFTYRLENTQYLRLDTGQGLKAVELKHIGEVPAAWAAFNGDYSIRAIGWRQDGSKPLWKIEQDLPLPFTLLSVASELSINA